MIYNLEDRSFNEDDLNEKKRAVLKAETYFIEKRSGPPDPNPAAKGSPHTILEKPGRDGQYTTHNGDGTFKQYRGSGKPHGNISRPNVKENVLNPSPTGLRPGGAQVRPAHIEEIPK